MNNKVFGIICANYNEEAFGTLLEKRTIASLPFGGRYRMIDFPLSTLVHAGITTVGVFMPYRYRSLIDHIGTGKPWNLDRKIDGLFILQGEPSSVTDRNHRIHLSDIIANQRYFQRRAEDSYGVFMTSSFIYNIDLGPILEAHEKSGKDITMVYYKNAAGKECYLNMSIIARKTILGLIEQFKYRSRISMDEAMKEFVNPQQVNKYVFDGYVKEIKDISDYVEANDDLLNPTIQAELFNSKRLIYTKTQDEAPALYAKGSSVKNSLVSAGCVVEGQIENCILFRNVTIKKGAILKNCVVMQHTVIEPKAKLTNCIIDKYVRVRTGVSMEGGKERPIIIGKNSTI